jgi:hypothetical protein
VTCSPLRQLYIRKQTSGRLDAAEDASRIDAGLAVGVGEARQIRQKSAQLQTLPVCCPCALSGHAVTAPPIRARKWRRFHLWRRIPWNWKQRARKRPPRNRPASQSMVHCQRPLPRSSPDAYGAASWRHSEPPTNAGIIDDESATKQAGHGRGQPVGHIKSLHRLMFCQCGHRPRPWPPLGHLPFPGRAYQFERKLRFVKNDVWKQG